MREAPTSVRIGKLAYPPTVNLYYGYRCLNCRSGRVSVYRKKAAKSYRDAVLRAFPFETSLTGRLSCVIELWTPDRRRRDLDNPLKAILDAITAAGIWEDDSLVDRLEVRRAGVKPGGEVSVKIETLEEGS